MKTVISMKWDGVTPDQYDQVRKTVNWEGDPPRGGIFHVAAFNNGALRVTDIWESGDEFNEFVKNRLMAGVAQVGITSEPQVEVFPVHAIHVPDVNRLK